MMKSAILNRITASGIVAVIRAETSIKAVRIAEACRQGGISALEITLTVPGALEVIKELTIRYADTDVIVGAGTVLDAKTAEAAILAGAKFVVGPNFDIATAQLCEQNQIPYLPGCLTITEMITAMKAGADIIKLFPGSAFGPAYVKAIRGPLPQIKIMPTGGVSLDNVHEWIQNGVVAVGVGGELTAPAKNGDYEGVTKLAAAFVRAVADARGEKS